MITNGEFVSRVVNDMAAVTKDVHISKRWILRTGQQKAETYVAQKWDELRIFGERNLYTKITCIPMERVRKIDCCFDEFKMCDVLMKSKDKIPGLVYPNLRPSILNVTSVDDNIQFTYTSLRKYKNASKRRFGKKDEYYYYVSDDYIYIPDTNIEAINAEVITLKKKEALAIGGCGDEDDDDSPCKSEWDFEFTCPSKLYEYIATETVNECFNKLKVTQDENPDMDSNIKSRTVQ